MASWTLFKTREAHVKLLLKTTGFLLRNAAGKYQTIKKTISSKKLRTFSVVQANFPNPKSWDPELPSR